MPIGQAKVGLLGNDIGKLELIETIVVSSSSYADFTNLGSYNVHFMTFNNIDTSSTSGLNGVFARYFESGVLESGSVYYLARKFGGASGAFNYTTSTSDSYVNLFSGSTAAGNNNGYCFFSCLTDSAKYSFNTMHMAGDLGTGSGFFMMYGGGVLPQTSAVDGIRISANTNFTDNFSGTISLYGIKDS